VEAAAPAGRLARELASRTRQLAAAARPPESGADVVRFGNLAELLASLLFDLARGEAARRWYWQRWGHLFDFARPAALASLMAEHLPRLATVCATLAGQRRLAEVWLALDEAAAGRVAGELAWRMGFVPPGARDIEGAGESPAIALPPLPHAVTARWAPVLARLARSASPRLLALLLIAQEAVPLALRQEPARVLAALERVFPASGLPREARPIAAAGERQGLPGAASGEASEPASQAESPREPAGEMAARPEFEGRRTIAADMEPATAERVLPESGDTRPLPHPADGGAMPLAPISIEALIPDQPLPTAGRADSVLPPSGVARTPVPELSALQWQAVAESFGQGFDSFRTGHGWLFYLLNFLDRREPQALMAANWEALPSGWAWLYLLGRELSLPPDDPVCDFLAGQLGLASRVELAMLPSLSAREALLSLAAAWYGPAGLWQPDLLRLEAQVRFTPTHVDLYAPLGSVRLPVRLAGLDLNPGWLPWLGRVVSFHYEA